MQPFVLANEIERRYGEYIRTSFPFSDPELASQLRQKIEQEHLLGTGPIVSLLRPFAHGVPLAQLVDEGKLHPLIGKIGAIRSFDLHAHQVRAFERLCDRNGRRSTIVATGTGSGKTEAFLLPILDYCARHPGEGVKALLVYPMNALANDQLHRLRAYLNGTGITFARYTGDTPQNDGDSFPGVLDSGATYVEGGPVPAEECFSREAIRRRHPNLLITSYRMLEYLLVRREDQAIFRPGGSPATLRYLVLDEVHTYGGALGAEVACLVRRLRGHIERFGDALTCVGTSATVGKGQHDAVLDFGSKLFAVAFEPDALIEEAHAPTRPPSGLLEPVDAPQAEIDALAEGTIATLDAAEAERLYRELDVHPTVAWLREQLAAPRALDDLVGDLMQALCTTDVEAARRQVMYFLLRGTMACDADGALLRPRLHVFFRGLVGATRCLRCGNLLQRGEHECPQCESRALPLEICRQCGQDYFRAAVADSGGTEAPSLHQLDSFETRIETPDELRDWSPSAARFVRQLHGALPTDDDEEGAEDAGSAPDASIAARVCTRPGCGFVTLRCGEGPCEKCCDERTVMLEVVSIGKLRACAACRSTYGVGREPITALSSSTAIGVSILTWLTLGNLDEQQRRLLIFADSRQDTAYQAGYLQDVTSEYSWRQLTYRFVGEHAGDPPDFENLWKRLYDEGRKRYGLFSRERAQQQTDDLHWFVAQEFGREATRRTSLESLGLAGIRYRFLDEIASKPAFARFRAACIPLPGGVPLPDDDLIALLEVTLDFVRRAGAISDEFATRYWGNLGELRGLDTYNRRPVAFRRPGANAMKTTHATIKPTVGTKGRPTAIQRFFQRTGVADTAAAVGRAVELLEDEGYLEAVTVGGEMQTQKTRDVLAVNAGMLAVAPPVGICRCRNCGTVNWRNVAARCIRPTCEGATLQPLTAGDDTNFYRHMYASVAPIRLEAREHSGQLSGAKREEYEREFKDGKINVLVASPTLELGVDIGGLATVLLRGLPPSPANYAQRAGRAGRRERIAVVSAYAQTMPHDAYFFAHPQEIIAGAIPAPHFELDNATIVRRHVRALALEKLERQLPRYMLGFLDLPEKENLSAEDYRRATLRTNLEALQELRSKRPAIVAAMQQAFHGERDVFACLTASEIGRVIDEFEHDLRDVLVTWHAEVVQIAVDIKAISDRAVPTVEDDRRRTQLQRTLRRLTAPPGPDRAYGARSEAYVLGYLSDHGFLPNYAFPGEPATLFSRDLEDGEVQRDPLLALTEFAPGARVYVDGKKILCNGLGLARSIGGSVAEYVRSAESKYRRCTACGHHAISAWVGDCPSCGSHDTQDEANRLDVKSFRGVSDAQINASEEQRRRTQFDSETALLGDPETRTRYPYENLRATLHCRQRLLDINHGVVRDGQTVPFVICLDCGEAVTPGAQADWAAQHLRRRQHKASLFTTDLTYEYQSDVLVLEAPSLDLDGATTLRNALLAAIRLEFQAEEDELEGFELSPNLRRGLRIILVESVTGGAGYLRRAAGQLPALAGRALRLMEHRDPCVRGCYQCLLTYRNQRDHDRIDKRLIVPLLEELAKETAPAPALEARDKRDLFAAGGLLDGASSGTSIAAESPIEVLLHAAMKAKLPAFETQVEVRDPETGSLVSRPDMMFGPQRLAVYADGYDYHSSKEQIERDIRVRGRMRELGYKVKAFPGRRIVGDLDGCIRELVEALEER